MRKRNKMVTDYLKSCRYKYDKLKNHIYLIVGSENITIDGGLNYNASAVSLSSITVVNGFNISYTEDDSLDERWRFIKTLKISVNGKVDIKDYSGDLYAVIETYDGTFYLVNTDFPLKFTYQFNLNKGTNQTDITLQTPSNMPTLQFIGNGLENAPECKRYTLNGIEKLSMIEKEKAVYDSTNNNLKITEELKAVEFLDNTCSLSEAYDGEKATTTIQFNISFDDYKTDWQYRLLEFKENLYRAVVYSKDNWEYYVGFNYGLQPSYSINSSSSNEFDTITITLAESSLQGCFKKQNLEENIDTGTTWEYIRILDEHKAYMCNMSHGCGMAQIVIMAEVDNFGNKTGNYKVEESIYDGVFVQDDPTRDYSWYEENFGWLRKYNVMGTFEDDYPNNWFPTNECACYDPSTKCLLSTDMPPTIEFDSTGTTSYTIQASCDWSIDNVPSGITISPTTGTANTEYTITITNNNASIREGEFSIGCCTGKYYYTVAVTDERPCIIGDTYKYIDCNGQTVEFQFKDGCELVVNNIPTGLLYTISNGVLAINVGQNSGQASRNYYIMATCCGEPITLTISQNPPVTVWLADGYICDDGTKYVKEVLWTGATYSNMTKTEQYRLGEMIEENSPDCRSIESFRFIGYTCQDGNKYELLRRFISYDDGETWIECPELKLGELVETESSFCEQETIYKWVLTDEWVCMDL